MGHIWVTASGADAPEPANALVRMPLVPVGIYTDNAEIAVGRPAGRSRGYRDLERPSVPVRARPIRGESPATDNRASHTGPPDPWEASSPVLSGDVQGDR